MALGSGEGLVTPRLSGSRSSWLSGRGKVWSLHVCLGAGRHGLGGRLGGHLCVVHGSLGPCGGLPCRCLYFGRCQWHGCLGFRCSFKCLLGQPSGLLLWRNSVYCRGRPQFTVVADLSLLSWRTSVYCRGGPQFTVVANLSLLSWRTSHIPL
jgi:hypothetical protein